MAISIFIFSFLLRELVFLELFAGFEICGLWQATHPALTQKFPRNA